MITINELRDWLKAEIEKAEQETKAIQNDNDYNPYEDENMSYAYALKSVVDKINKTDKTERLEKLRLDWFDMFGYEKDVNERINHELNISHITSDIAKG